MEISSSSFQHMAPMASRYASRGVTGGENISPSLEWKNIPDGAASLILTAVDIHPVANNWIHWFVININPSVKFLPEGASLTRMPAGSIELYNSFGSTGYGGPMPPRGSGQHRYVFTLRVLNVASVGLPLHASLASLAKEIEGHMLASASITGIFER